jgi:hypothetical protein
MVLTAETNWIFQLQVKAHGGKININKILHWIEIFKNKNEG